MSSLSISVQPTSPSALKRFIRRYPLSSFLAMAFLLAWSSAVPLLLSKRGFGILPVDLPVDAFITLASFLGLVLPAFVVTAVTDGQAGVQDLLRRCLRWRVGVQWYLIALFGTFTAVIVAALPFFGITPLQLVTEKWGLLVTVLLPGILVPFLLFNLPEEIGWTGFLQARLQERYSPVRASIMITPVFALLHLPAYFVVGWIGEEPASLSRLPEVLLLLVLTALFSIGFRLLIMWLYNSTGGSLIIVALFHSAFNMSTGPAITPQFVPGSDPLVGNLLPWGAAAVGAVLLIVVTRGRLARAVGRSIATSEGREVASYPPAPNQLS